MFVIRTRVGPSPIHGTGVFACDHVEVGRPVWRFQPPFDQVFSEDDVAVLSDVVRDFLEIYAYRSTDLGGKLVLSGDHARFLNHSFDPNTEERPFVSVARRRIALGDEITCNYSTFSDWLGFDE